MNATEIAAALDRYAASDLRLARREGDISVCETKQGTLSLTYENGVYRLSTTGLDSKVLAEGKPAVVRPVLASLYTVDIQA